MGFRKTRKTKGGKYIGRGTFGCTFRPAVRCKAEKMREKNAIAKVMTVKNADSEYKFTPLLMKIDPEQIFTLYPYKICEPQLDATNLNYRASSECSDILSKAQKKVIFLKDGGADLFNVLERLPKGGFNKIHRNLFRAFMNLFLGLEHLHKNDFVHLDIKLENIVCKITSGLELRIFGFFPGGKPNYLMKFIDFGLSNTVDEAFKNNTFFSYVVWPFELRLASDTYFLGLADLTAADLKSDFYKIRYFNQEYLPYWLLRDAAKTPTIASYKAIQTYIKSLGPEGKLEVRREILKKADVYGLGLVLANCYYTLTGIKKTDEGVYSAEHPLNVPFYDLIDKMTHPDYRQRLTVKDARVEYEQVLSAIERHFSIRVSTLVKK